MDRTRGEGADVGVHAVLHGEHVDRVARALESFEEADLEP